MEMKIVERIDVFADKDGNYSVKIADLAEFEGIDSEEFWRVNYYFFRNLSEGKIRDGHWDGANVLSSLKMDDFFWMDRNGNEIDGKEEKTGFCVNGQPEKTLGSWDEIFIPIELAKEIDESLFEGY